MAGRRQATAEEAKALAHPLRLRILRLCLDEVLTNKELADRLELDAGTVLFHVRTLVATGFLEGGDPRQGRRGAWEKPYRATGKSWTLDVSEHRAEEQALNLAVLDAFRAEVMEAGTDSVRAMGRLAVTLDEAGLDELRSRLEDVLDEFVARPPAPGGRPYGIIVGIHERAWPTGPGGGTGQTQGT